MYSDLKLTANTIQVGQQIGIQVNVQNTGQVSAEEVSSETDLFYDNICPFCQVYLLWDMNTERKISMGEKYFQSWIGMGLKTSLQIFYV